MFVTMINAVTEAKLNNYIINYITMLPCMLPMSLAVIEEQTSQSKM